MGDPGFFFFLLGLDFFLPQINPAFYDTKNPSFIKNLPLSRIFFFCQTLIQDFLLILICPQKNLAQSQMFAP